MELCTQCNLPEGAHTRRIFGHDFKRPVAANPQYAGELVDALNGLADAAVDVSTSADAGGDADCDGE